MIRGLIFLSGMMIGNCALAQEEGGLLRKLSPDAYRAAQRSSALDSFAVSVSYKGDSVQRFPVSRWQKVFPGLYRGKATGADILRLASDAAVLFVNLYQTPKEELSTGAVDYTLNGVTLAHHRFSLVSGSGVTVSVKERAFDTADVDFKGRVVSSVTAASTVTPHASLMATIAAGGGASSPQAVGVAPGAAVGSSDFTNLFPDASTVLQQQKVTVQNHSYGTVVETFYGNEAAAYDASVAAAPTVLHVFSAGNSGAVTTAAGTYAGVAGVANLTGNFKQSKNTLSVGALDSSGKTMQAASKGPAYDGRIKPELAAYGEDGSSGAAALVSGTAALVQEAYAQATPGSVPSAALVKAVLINSADDVGTPGPDYASGYGSLNAAEAVETVLQGRYLQDRVGAGSAKTFNLSVPASCALLKVTLIWTDHAAAPSAAKALVNNLDLTLRDAASTTWMPWVLNAFAAKDSLEAPAVRKLDTLNNAEQITVLHPAAGNCTINVAGSIVFGLQDFALAYQFDTAATVAWSYPSGSDALTAGTEAVVRWSATLSGSASLQYKLAGQWQTVGNVDLSAARAKWKVPVATSLFQLRLVATSGQTFLSDTFAVSPQPEPSVGFDCADSVLIHWRKLSTPYRVYRLGDKYLEAFRTTTDTAVLFSKSASPSLYYAVAPLVGNRPGVRSNTLRYPSAGIGCYFTAFYLQQQASTKAVFTAVLGTLFNVRSLALQKRTPTGYVTVQNIGIPSATSLTLEHDGLLSGENRYRLALTLNNGLVVYSDVETVFYFSPQAPVWVYPNPASQSGPLQLLSSGLGVYTVHIYNAAGSEVYNELLTRMVTLLPSRRFAKGLYIVRITDKAGGRWIQKFIVQ